ncbi:MAG: GNAT family N-acetyltransferase [Arcobacter sp.]|nr:MAG: GNAT family N-acetyltransferase [Arcobacter sp.]
MKNLKIIDLKDCDKNYFDKAWDIYISSFPSYERRTLSEQKLILEDKKYEARIFIKDNQVLAILFFWHFSKYTFVEHFAINKSFRGQSYGSKILKNFMEEYKNIILEIEPIKDEISEKRYKFYEKFGFLKNEHIHFQVPFRKGDEKFELLLLSLKKLEKKEYQNLYKEMKNSLCI